MLIDIVPLKDLLKGFIKANISLAKENANADFYIKEMNELEGRIKKEEDSMIEKDEKEGLRIIKKQYESCCKKLEDSIKINDTKSFKIIISKRISAFKDTIKDIEKKERNRVYRINGREREANDERKRLRIENEIKTKKRRLETTNFENAEPLFIKRKCVKGIDIYETCKCLFDKSLKYDEILSPNYKIDEDGNIINPSIVNCNEASKALMFVNRVKNVDSLSLYDFQMLRKGYSIMKNVDFRYFNNLLFSNSYFESLKKNSFSVDIFWRCVVHFLDIEDIKSLLSTSRYIHFNVKRAYVETSRTKRINDEVNYLTERLVKRGLLSTKVKFHNVLKDDELEELLLIMNNNFDDILKKLKECVANSVWVVTEKERFLNTSFRKKGALRINKYDDRPNEFVMRLRKPK